MTDRFKVEVEKRGGIFIPNYSKVTVGHRNGFVHMLVDHRLARFTPSIASLVGLAIFKAQLEPNDLFVLVINGERIRILPPEARKVATALLRKADDADDWQIEQRRKSNG